MVPWDHTIQSSVCSHTHQRHPWEYSSRSQDTWIPQPSIQACMLYWLDNFTSYIHLSVCSLWYTEDTLCSMPWLCFCNSIHHSLNDLMKKKPGLASRMRDSRYPMWLPLFHSSRVWRKMLQLSQVLLQLFQLSFSLPCPLAFLLFFFSLLYFRVSGHGGLTLRLLLLFPLLFLALLCPIVISFTFSFTAGGASLLLFNGWLSGLVWHKEFLGRHLFTLPRSILHWHILGRRVHGGCISQSTLLALLKLCQ